MELEKRGGETGGDEDDEPNDEDSVIELGQIALLSSSRMSLRRSIDAGTIMSASRRSLGVGASRRSLGTSSKRSLYKKPPEIAAEAIAGKQPPAQLADGVVVAPQVELVDGGVHGACYGFMCAYKAYFISLVSVMLFCLASIMMRYSKWLTGSDHSFIRYIEPSLSSQP